MPTNQVERSTKSKSQRQEQKVASPPQQKKSKQFIFYSACFIIVNKKVVELQLVVGEWHVANASLGGAAHHRHGNKIPFCYGASPTDCWLTMICLCLGRMVHDCISSPSTFKTSSDPMLDSTSEYSPGAMANSP
jgi:hypothetical protein